MSQPEFRQLQSILWAWERLAGMFKSCAAWPTLLLPSKATATPAAPPFPGFGKGGNHKCQPSNSCAARTPAAPPPASAESSPASSSSHPAGAPSLPASCVGCKINRPRQDQANEGTHPEGKRKVIDKLPRRCGKLLKISSLEQMRNFPTAFRTQFRTEESYLVQSQ
jgi:hypothetical protein